jgi:hydrocephalus-inducing protein
VPERSERDLARPKRIRCVLEPHHDQDPLELIVQGRGIEAQEEASKVLEFSTEVRERQTMQVMFPPDGKNTTGETWTLTPLVKTLVPSDVDYWFCPSEVVVPPGGQVPVDISYRPLTMTAVKKDTPEPAKSPDGKTPEPPKKESAKEGEEAPEGGEAGDEQTKEKPKPKRRLRPKVKAARESISKPRPPEKHMGNIFVPTPDGSAFVFNLEGVSLAPKEAKRISAEVNCKTSHVQSVPMTNWLQESQRFNVSLKLVEPEGAGEDIKLHGIETFDLPAGGTKDYKFSMYSYKEGTALVSLVFTNPRTDEYVPLEVDFKFVAPSNLDTIRFDMLCRQTATKSITVVNPLSVPTTFKCEASNPEMRLVPPELTVLPGTQASIDVIFRPVLPGEGQASVHLRSEQLGVYPYAVLYNVKPSGLDKTIVFKAPLGLNTIQTFKFMHYSRKATTFTSTIEAAPGHKVAGANFTLAEAKDQKGNLAAAGEDGLEASIDIRFQPSSLGEVRALLVVSSPEAGDYKALLVGYTQPPQPQGPVTIINGKSGAVDFSNPFDEAVEFSIQVDNPVFSVNSRMIKLDPKKSQAITVQLKTDSPQSGRLVITSQKHSMPWVYFLKGVMA